MAAREPHSSDLNPDAPIYEPLPRQPSHPSGFPATQFCRGPPPLPALAIARPFQVLPPPVVASPFHVLPPPPPVVASSFHVLPPPPPPLVFPGPFQGPPPPPMPMPHLGPARATDVAPPQGPCFKTAMEDGGDTRPPADAGTWRVASGKLRRPKPLLAPRIQRGRPAPAFDTVAVADGRGKQVSPRSVIAVGNTSSPPDTPPVVRPVVAPPSVDSGREAMQRCRPVPPSGGSAPTAPRLRARQAARRGSRRRDRDPDCGKTTLMIRNIPNGFTRERVLNILDEHCAEENAKVPPGGVLSEYDFLYVPFDFGSKYNLGYCFVNFTTPEAAIRLRRHLINHKWTQSRKTCAVVWADIQGHDEIVGRFSGSRFPCDTEEFLPLRFVPPRNGARPVVGEAHVVGRATGALWLRGSSSYLAFFPFL